MTAHNEHYYNSWNMKANTALTCLVSLSCLNPAPGFSPYLDFLDSARPPPQPTEDGPEVLRPEEFYGVTNPMANNWPGSKHQKYGGYLTRLSPGNTQEVENYNVDSKAPDEWYGKSNPMASWCGYKNPQWGGYLESLQHPGSSTE